MTFSVQYHRLAAVLAVAAALSGCGGNDAPATPTPSPTPTPTPPPQVISYQPVWELPSGFYIVDNFSIPSPGTVTATVDWQSTRNNVDAYVTNAACTPKEFFDNGRKCRFYDRDEKPAAKPTVLSFEAGQDHVGGARIYIINRGPDAEKGSFMIELSRAQ